MSKHNFEVGDRVEIKSWEEMEKEYGNTSGGGISTTIGFAPGMRHLCGLRATIVKLDKNGIVDLDFDIKKGCCNWTFSTDMLKPIPNKNEIIVIYRNKNKVIALDKRTGKKAEAKCSPEDEFDFGTGAKLAFDRLIQPEPTPEYFTGKVVCVHSESECFTKGKIYEITNGRLYNNFGNNGVDDVVSVNDLNNKMFSQFIQIVE